MESALHSDTSTIANGVNGPLSFPEKNNGEKLEKADARLGLGNVILQENGKLVLAELDPEDDPKNLPLLRKWVAVIVISTAAFCTACTSSIVSIVPPVSLCFSPPD